MNDTRTTGAAGTATAPGELPQVRAYGATSNTSPLGPLTIPRRAPGPSDVQMQVLYCGVCHSDLHQVRDEWHENSPTVYPCVPGHEIVGRVTTTGRDVRKFRAGDLAAVGCLVDSCGVCEACAAGEEQFCSGPATFTYNSTDPATGGVTYGGYSDSLVVDEAFVLRLRPGQDLAGVAPLLCAGITTYSPLRHWNVRPGQTVGVVGLGGLGHMAVKLARALEARVVVFTNSAQKVPDALRLGAHEVVLARNSAAMQAHQGKFDFIVDTVSAPHDLNALLDLVKRNGTMTLVGAPEAPTPVGAFRLIGGRKRLAGSLIGGIRETQEMLDFCADHGLTADVELVPIQRINEAYARLLAGDVKYRFVIDMASLRS